MFGRKHRGSDSSSNSSSSSSNLSSISAEEYITSQQQTLLSNLSTQRNSLASLITSRERQLRCSSLPDVRMAEAELMILRRRFRVVEGRVRRLDGEMEKRGDCEIERGRVWDEHAIGAAL